MTKNNLKHVGVLGMKWGKRKAKQDNSSNDSKIKTALSKKKVNELSNDDLAKINKRLSLEKEFKRLNPSKRDKVADAISGFSSTIVKSVLVGLAVSQIQSIVKKKLGVGG